MRSIRMSPGKRPNPHHSGRRPGVRDGARGRCDAAAIGRTRNAAHRARSRRAPRPSAAEEGSGRGAENGFKKILLLLRNHSGVDFSLYKSTTIQRRITRRMVLNKQNTLEDYAEFLRGNAKELDALYSDVLISVTSFFRNPEAFDVLKQQGLSQAPPAARRRSAPRLGARLLHRPGGVFHRHGVRGSRARMRRACASSRCSPPTSTMRCWTRPATVSTPRASRRISRRNGCGGSSSRRKAATASSSRCARWSSSPGRISSAIRRSRAWTSSVAATC